MQALSPIFQNPGYHPAMPAHPHPFGQRLARLRQQRAWSQAELARRLGTSRGMVAYYESCAKNPTIEFVEKVAHAFDIPASELLDAGTAHKKRGPASRLEQLTEQLTKLPKTQQRLVIQMLEGALRQQNGKQAA
jgi:transcriptional regulator with XRE-family HTH domain